MVPFDNIDRIRIAIRLPL